MSDKLRVVNYRQMKALLESFGFVAQPRTSGTSHVKFIHEDGRKALIPDHGELTVGLLRNTLRDIRITRDQYHERLRQL